MDQSVASVPLAVRFFGGAAIEEAGRPVSSRAGHRHPLALLALLSTAPGRSMSRDKLMAFLWPEADPGSLRHRLSVTVYEVRKALGKDAVASVQDDLRLNTEALWIDVIRFEGAIARGDHDEAIELHRGPFLDGFHVLDSAEFAEWAAAERERLARAYCRALEASAGEAERGGDLRQAVRWWRRAVEQDPYGSRALLGLMRALDAAGERGEALRVAERQARALEAELGAAQDPAVTALAARIRDGEGGKSQPAPQPPLSSEPAVAELSVRANGDATRDTTSRDRPRRTAAVAAIAGLLLLLAIPWIPTPGGTADEVVPDRVVVLPFVVRGSSDFAYLGDGMAEILGTTLDGVGTLRTADPHAVLAFVRENGMDPADPAAGRRTAERFGAGRFVLGSIVESGERLHVQATVYRADGTIEARGSAGAGEDSDFFEMVDGLTRQLLVPRFDPDEERLTRLAVVSSSSLAALKAYLQGEANLRRGDFEAASEAFGRATRADSTFALAWYRLAMAAEWAFQPHDAAIAVHRALRLADRLPARDRLLLVGWDAYARGE
ncbi:MAG: BTAD domain-containing putative transcriptional regulator, partial [Gemmatimonadota bacterium]